MKIFFLGRGMENIFLEILIPENIFQKAANFCKNSVF